MRAFFTLAAVSTNRQRTFRAIVSGHLALLLIGLFVMLLRPAVFGPVLLGAAVLVAGIIEGALLIGWRLTQLPKSQALEFLLVSSVRPSAVLVAEALVGLTLLGFTTLAGLPIFVMMAGNGMIYLAEAPVLLAMPFVFGRVARGLGGSPHGRMSRTASGAGARRSRSSAFSSTWWSACSLGNSSAPG